MNLLEHLVDVDTVRLLPPRLPLFLVSLDRVIGGGLAGFLGCLFGNFGRHPARVLIGRNLKLTAESSEDK